VPIVPKAGGSRLPEKRAGQGNPAIKPLAHPGNLSSSDGSETSGRDPEEPQQPPKSAESKVAFREGA